MSRLARAVPALFAISVVLVACGDDDTVFVTNGTNDLRKACDVRLGWKRAKEVRCQECLAFAPLATCNCTVSAPYVGKCAQQLDLKKATPSCDQPLERCTAACGSSDCGCIETCYSTRLECKTRAAALDGCVSDVCASVCD